MAAEDECRDIFDANFQFVGDEGAEAGGVENAGHPDNALAGEAAHFVSRLGHRVERIRDDDQNAIRGMLNNFADYIFHDFVVRVQQVIAAHTGLARNSGGDNDDVGVGGVGVIVGAEDVGIALLDRHGLEQVEGFALRHAFNDVDEDDVGEFFGGDPVGGCRADVSRTYDAYFLSHEFSFSERSRAFNRRGRGEEPEIAKKIPETFRSNCLFCVLCETSAISAVKSFYAVVKAAAMFSIMLSANLLVLTLVAPGIRRSKSYVTFFCSIVRSRPLSMRSAA